MPAGAPLPPADNPMACRLESSRLVSDRLGDATWRSKTDPISCSSRHWSGWWLTEMGEQ